MLDNAHANPMIPVTDLPRARQFYEGILELTPLDAMPHYGVLSYRLKHGTMFDIYVKDKPSSGEHTVANFYVDNVSALADQMIAKGVQLTRIELDPHSPMAFDERGVLMDGDRAIIFFINDPDGNRLSFSFMPAEVQEALGWRKRG